MIRIFLIAALLCVMPCFADEYKPELIKDELVETTLQNVSNVYPKANLDYDYWDTDIKTDRTIKPVYYKPLRIQDNLVKIHLQKVSGVYPAVNLKPDYTNINFLPLRLKFMEEISTKDKTHTEGQTIKFEVVQDVYDGKKKILSRGAVGYARIETISPRGFMGVPADIIISHFEVGGLEPLRFQNDVVKYGFNLMALAAALKYSIGTFIPGTGYLFMLIKGGNANIKPDDVFEVKYAY